MATSIEVNKRKIQELLASGREHKFVIPAYQRPYEWGKDELDALFDDLYNFVVTTGGSKRNNTYFLGSIVSFENDNNEQEIIDGQQRLTSIFLLLRAIYEVLRNGIQTPEAENMMRKIETAIWDADKLKGTVLFDKVLISSEVISTNANESFRSILECGVADENAKDNYTRNYLYLQKRLRGLSQDDPMALYEFTYSLLEQAIVLPIKADTQDSALTIFNTLNDRGLPLSDADIFKAKIYNNLDDEAGKIFIKRWQELEEEVSESSDESIQKLFTYYMFYLRAKENDIDTTTPGVRKYYAGVDGKFARLLQVEDILTELSNVYNIWRVIERHQSIDNESWSTNSDLLQTLDILSSYPNEFWKYPIITYYICYHNNADFDEKFLIFANRLLSELLSRYLVDPTINAVKSGVLRLNASIIKSENPEFNFAQKNKFNNDIDFDSSALEKQIQAPHAKIVRMILKTIAYADENQKELLPDKWEIEHIFPRRYQANYFEYDPKEASEKIEHIGNKLPFEKRLNIVAGNGYFGKKREQYDKSNIAIVRDFGNRQTEWSLDDIVRRDQKVSDIVISKIKDGIDNYA